ncbi:hypothetical protein V6N13_034057 [Hibiscus sabdariffa]
MEVNRNNGQQLTDGQNLPAQADGAIAPPIPLDNQQPPVRTVRDYLAEDLEVLNPAVTMPEFEAEHFELKPVMFNMLNTLGQFGGSPTENARQHLKSFLEICNSFKIHGVSNDVLKLKLYPYSLRDNAKAWLNNLQSASLQSWTQLCRSFLAKFSYTNITDHLRNHIISFRKEDDEAMDEAWERYRDLFRRCLDDKGDASTETTVLPGQVNLGGYFRIRQSVLLCYWLIPKSYNCLSCLYTISLDGKAVTFLLPLSQGYLPCKANYCCIFLAAETLLLPIPRRS